MSAAGSYVAPEERERRLRELARMVFPELNPEVYYSALLDKPNSQVFTKSLWNILQQHKDPETDGNATCY